MTYYALSGTLNPTHSLICARRFFSFVTCHIQSTDLLYGYHFGCIINNLQSSVLLDIACHEEIAVRAKNVRLQQQMHAAMLVPPFRGIALFRDPCVFPCRFQISPYGRSATNSTLIQLNAELTFKRPNIKNEISITTLSCSGPMR